MSTIENQNVPQKQKSYKKYSQDHGDAAQNVVHRQSEFFTDKTLQATLKKETEFHQAGLADALDYQSMTPSELETEADRLLGEPSTEHPSVVESARKALEEARASYDGESVGDLIDKHQALLNQREALLNYIDEDEKDYGNTLDIQALIREIEAELAVIEEDAVEMNNDQSALPTEVEFGVRSKREITREMARRATLDPGEDDDYGDSDYTTPIRIRNRL